MKELLENDQIIGCLASLLALDQREYEIVIQRLKEAGLTARGEATLRKVVKSQRNSVVPVNLGENLPITACIKDAPVAPNIVVPGGYEISLDDGVNLVAQKGLELVASSPVLMMAIFKDIADSSEVISLVWYRDDIWRKEMVPKLFIINAHQITSLAQWGLPVTSTTAKKLVDFLYLFEAENRHILPKGNLSSKFGWVKKGFLYGMNFIPKGGKKVFNANLKKLEPNNLRKGSIFYNYADSGEYNLAMGYSGKGTLKKWKKVVPLIEDNPIICFMCYAALAAPLLKIMKQPNFIVDLSGLTSMGKSTALMIAASVFGNPNMKKSTGILKTWNVTQVYLERLSAKVNDLPRIYRRYQAD